MNELNVIHVTSDRIYYLNPDILNSFSNLTLVSVTGHSVKMNPLTLASFHSDLTKFLNMEDDEHKIITEFSTEDLEKLVKFCHEGILPEPFSNLEKENKNPLIFTAFDINLNQCLFGTKNEEKIKKENENLVIKNELLDDFDLDDIVQTLMETEKVPTKVKKPRGRPKKIKTDNILNSGITEEFFDNLITSTGKFYYVNQSKLM